MAARPSTSSDRPWDGPVFCQHCSIKIEYITNESERPTGDDDQPLKWVHVAVRNGHEARYFSCDFARNAMGLWNRLTIDGTETMATPESPVARGLRRDIANAVRRD